MADARRQLEQGVDDVLRQHDVGPAREARDAIGHGAEPILEVLAHRVIELMDPVRGGRRSIGSLRDLDADALDDPGTDPIAPGKIARISKLDPMMLERDRPRLATLELVADRQVELQVAGIQRHGGFGRHPDGDRTWVVPQHDRDLDLGVRILGGHHLEPIDARHEPAQHRTAEHRFEGRRKHPGLARHRREIDDAKGALGTRSQRGQQRVAPRARATPDDDPDRLVLARAGQEPQRPDDQRARHLELLEIAVHPADLEVLIGLALGRLIRDVANDQRIDAERCVGPLSGADAHEAVTTKRSIAIELARDLSAEARPQDLPEQVLVDDGSTGVVGENAIEPGELAEEARGCDREQDRDSDRSQVKVAREHLERCQPTIATALCGADHLFGRTQPCHASGQLVRGAAAGQPEEARDLICKRRSRRIGPADPSAVPAFGDPDVDPRADQLDAKIDRLRDLGGGRGRCHRDRVEPNERRVRQRLVFQSRLNNRRRHFARRGGVGDHLDRRRMTLAVRLGRGLGLGLGNFGCYGGLAVVRARGGR